ncbi:MAG: HNH endonuclease, partial [Frankiales bacterium]|nr:HNH endonuclease [Frankiales bacterium]
RLLQARDRTCVFPGCPRIATRTDLDHRIPWPAGMTSTDNLQCLCRHHHRAKHAIFTVKADPDTTIVWITRGGWIFRRHPHRHRPQRRPQGD